MRIISRIGDCVKAFAAVYAGLRALTKAGWVLIMNENTAKNRDLISAAR
jgi:hypothetical protein